MLNIYIIDNIRLIHDNQRTNTHVVFVLFLCFPLPLRLWKDLYWVTWEGDCYSCTHALLLLLLSLLQQPVALHALLAQRSIDRSQVCDQSRKLCFQAFFKPTPTIIDTYLLDDSLNLSCWWAPCMLPRRTFRVYPYQKHKYIEQSVKKTVKCWQMIACSLSIQYFTLARRQVQLWMQATLLPKRGVSLPHRGHSACCATIYLAI